MHFCEINIWLALDNNLFLKIYQRIDIKFYTNVLLNNISLHCTNEVTKRIRNGGGTELLVSFIPGCRRWNFYDHFHFLGEIYRLPIFLIFKKFKKMEKFYFDRKKKLLQLLKSLR